MLYIFQILKIIKGSIYHLEKIMKNINLFSLIVVYEIRSQVRFNQQTIIIP